MKITIVGGRVFVGTGISEVHTSAGKGEAGGHDCHVDDDKSDGVGLSVAITRFTLDLPDCNCALRPGDWIDVSTTTFLFVDIGRVSFSLCGGACTGSKDIGLRGIGLGLGISKIRWVVE